MIVGSLLLVLVLVAGGWYAYNHRPKAAAPVATVAPNAPDVTLLLPPGLTLQQIATRVGALPGHTAANFLKVAQSNTIRSKYEPAGTTSLEGLLFPDTYKIGATETDASIVQRLVTRFDQIADQANLSAAAHGVTPYQAVIVASLIEKEVKIVDEGPTVAAVIYNRLAKKMQLQIDATLCYAKGGCPPAPTNADKASTSPYNTYKIAALPPTPIASVTAADLQAALAPANVTYLYYVVADAAGHHAFANTLDQQNQNIAAAKAKGLL